MNDKELANKIITLGIGSSILGWPGRKGVYMVLLNERNKWQDIEVFVRDWRVVGALIEKCEAIAIDWSELEPDHWRNMNYTANTPRAIAERCTELLTNPASGE